MNNLMDIMNKYSQFQNIIKGKNPQELLQNLVSSGKVSKEQLSQCSEMARMISNFAKLK